MKCFIRNCDTGTSNSRHKKKSDKSLISSGSLAPPRRYQKRSMFRPKSAKMLKAWERAIPDQNKELKMIHFLCELHFKKEDIDRERVIYKKGGIVERELKKIPLLNDEAVPCFFPESLTPRVKQECSVELKLPVNCSELVKEVCAASIQKKHLKESERKPFYEDLLEYVKENYVDKVFCFTPNPFKLLRFSHITPDSAVWCWWNTTNTAVLKRLIIFKSSKVQIFLQENEIHLPGYAHVETLEDCKKLVQKVSNVEPCIKMDFVTGSSKCPGYVEVDWSSKTPGPKRRRCSFCIKFCDAERKRAVQEEKDKKLMKKN